ncbi:unnamed protein product [Protopolystoma xenopodis]|uniref:Hexosyltransferase n=1 Tax=Protopolystoma xenopodis TaxID=117903 RepID=A0A3S5CUS1_9PLAT|nr:unnamed protein product [Protopolystoma xenopodis]
MNFSIKTRANVMLSIFILVSCSAVTILVFWSSPNDQITREKSLIYLKNLAIESDYIKDKSISSTSQPHHHSEYKSRRSDWNALMHLTPDSLSPRIFYNPCKSVETAKSDANKEMRLLPIPTRSPLFSSMRVPHPENVDVASELCRFKNGLQLSNTTRNLMDSNWTDAISSRLLYDAVTVCDMNRLDRVIDLLVVISSRPYRAQQRGLIRKYWARDNCYAGRNVRHVFLTGIPPKGDVEEVIKLLSEARQENDLVVQSFDDPDIWANTHKLFLGLQWSLAYCKYAKLVLFTSDEIFLVPENVIGFIESVSDSAREHLVAGEFYKHALVQRNIKHPEHVPFSEFALSEWPDFVNLQATFIGAELLLDLYIAARMVRLVRHSAGFLGITLLRLQILPWGMPNLYITKDKLDTLQSNKVRQTHLVAALLPENNDLSQNETFASWWKLHDCEKMCIAENLGS